MRFITILIGRLFYTLAGIAAFFGVFAPVMAWNYRGADGWVTSMMIVVGILAMCSFACFFVGHSLITASRRK